MVGGGIARLWRVVPVVVRQRTPERDSSRSGCWRPADPSMTLSVTNQCGEVEPIIAAGTRWLQLAKLGGNWSLEQSDGALCGE